MIAPFTCSLLPSLVRGALRHEPGIDVIVAVVPVPKSHADAAHLELSRYMLVSTLPLTPMLPHGDADIPFHDRLPPRRAPDADAAPLPSTWRYTSDADPTSDAIFARIHCL